VSLMQTGDRCLDGIGKGRSRPLFSALVESSVSRSPARIGVLTQERYEWVWAVAASRKALATRGLLPLVNQAAVHHSPQAGWEMRL
jgi:hypothetical protein